VALVLHLGLHVLLLPHLVVQPVLVGLVLSVDGVEVGHVPGALLPRLLLQVLIDLDLIVLQYQVGACA